MFEYNCTLSRVIDGDTVELSIDLGFRLSVREIIRLEGIDAPETRGPEREKGALAKDRMSHLIARSLELRVVTGKGRGKYRWLGTLYGLWPDAGGGAYWINLNQEMIARGHAKPYTP